MMEGKVVRILPIASYEINQTALPFVDFTLDEKGKALPFSSMHRTGLRLS